MNKLYGGYSSKGGVARHDLSRRRTLKKKSVLLKQYSLYFLATLSFGFVVHLVNKKINPVEYRSAEEQEKAEIPYGLPALFNRMSGLIDSLREKNRNQSVQSGDKIDNIYMPKAKRS